MISAASCAFVAPEHPRHSAPHLWASWDHGRGLGAFPTSAALAGAEPAAAQPRHRRAATLKAGNGETAGDSTILFTGFSDQEIGDSVLTLRSATFHLL